MPKQPTRHLVLSRLSCDAYLETKSSTLCFRYYTRDGKRRWLPLSPASPLLAKCAACRIDVLMDATRLSSTI